LERFSLAQPQQSPKAWVQYVQSGLKAAEVENSAEEISMNINTRIALCGAALAALILPAAAQTANPPANPPTINQRKENQQDRIANGVGSGELTAGETSNLEKKESNLNKEEKLMRSEDNGKLTGADRKVLNQQQNQLSNQIYKDKHNAAVQNTNPKSEVGKRAENQQDRIAQGIKSGQLTAGEASNLEHKEAGINREVRTDRAANGGNLTQQERAQVNRQQNRLSNQIYNKKHNGRRQ
jgi:hypothetical protein